VQRIDRGRREGTGLLVDKMHTVDIIADIRGTSVSQQAACTIVRIAIGYKPPVAARVSHLLWI